jgi:hypothetical protein
MLCGSKSVISSGVTFAPKFDTLDQIHLKVIVRNEYTRVFHTDWYDNTVLLIFCVKQGSCCRFKENILLTIAPVNYFRDLCEFQIDAALKSYPATAVVL